MDCTVYLNRQVLGEWKYGYSSFYFDMTDFLCEGENEIEMCIRDSLYWGISKDNTPAQQAEAIRNTWKAYIDTANGL